MMKFLLENNFIQKDLTRLCQIMSRINLNEVAQKLEEHKEEFQDMSEDEFTYVFSEELEKLGKQSYNRKKCQNVLALCWTMLTWCTSIFGCQDGNCIFKIFLLSAAQNRNYIYLRYSN